MPLAAVVLAVKGQNRRRVQQVVGSDFDDEGAAELVGDRCRCVEAVAAVEALGEGVVDGEADIGGGVGLGLVHGPDIADVLRLNNMQRAVMFWLGRCCVLKMCWVEDAVLYIWQSNLLKVS